MSSGGFAPRANQPLPSSQVRTIVPTPSVAGGGSVPQQQRKEVSVPPVSAGNQLDPHDLRTRGQALFRVDL